MTQVDVSPACLFQSQRRQISVGDTATVVFSLNASKTVKLEPAGGVLNCQYGCVKHEELIGRDYGTKIAVGKKENFIYLLPLNPDLWTKTLPHRTQIIYSTDAAMIVQQLFLQPGKRVFEAGIGSGSLSHHLARAVFPDGKVDSFDFHELRAQQAKQEFDSHGLKGLLEAHHRDVISQGFPSDLPPVDAIILDLPNPWSIICKLPGYLCPDRVTRVCVFAPCIEQVQRTCLALRESGFIKLQTHECLARKYCMRKVQSNIPNLGQKHLRLNTSDEVDVRQPMVSDPASFAHPDAKLTDPDNPKSSYTYESLPEVTMAGHTGFLTFATLLPRSKDNASL